MSKQRTSGVVNVKKKKTAGLVHEQSSCQLRAAGSHLHLGEQTRFPSGNSKYSKFWGCGRKGNRLWDIDWSELRNDNTDILAR